MAQNNQCKMEFYFTRENMEKLLRENPKARGIIICQEIKIRHTSDNEKVSVIEITARADNGKTRGLLQAVHGCPQPPGCI